MNVSAASEKVFTYGVIRELMRWIESNPHRRITVDDCAEKPATPNGIYSAIFMR